MRCLIEAEILSCSISKSLNHNPTVCMCMYSLNESNPNEPELFIKLISLTSSPKVNWMSVHNVSEYSHAVHSHRLYESVLYNDNRFSASFEKWHSDYVLPSCPRSQKVTTDNILTVQHNAVIKVSTLFSVLGGNFLTNFPKASTNLQWQVVLQTTENTTPCLLFWYNRI